MHVRYRVICDVDPPGSNRSRAPAECSSGSDSRYARVAVIERSIGDGCGVTQASSTRRSALRWLVYVSLITSAITSLVIEPIISLYVTFGVIFVLLVGCHLVQRQRISKRLALRHLKVNKLLMPAGRPAIADGFLFTMTAAMLFSAFWDL